MTLAELQKLLEATGMPVAYSHFTKTMKPPFITYLTPYTTNFQADNRVYHKIPVAQIELYTKNKDPLTESKLENVLDDAEIPYDMTSEVYIESEKVRQVIYEINLL